MVGRKPDRIQGCVYSPECLEDRANDPLIFETDNASLVQHLPLYALLGPDIGTHDNDVLDDAVDVSEGADAGGVGKPVDGRDGHTWVQDFVLGREERGSRSCPCFRPSFDAPASEAILVRARFIVVIVVIGRCRTLLGGLAFLILAGLAKVE